MAIIMGARPQIIKSAPIIREAFKHTEIMVSIIHTGQHYDYEMSEVFFEELELPDPVVNLGVGSGLHGWQTGSMLVKIEEFLLKDKPDLVMVPGDTNSTLAGALAAVKLKIPVIHVEAGARSYDLSMPEEINRRLTDHCSTFLFPPTKNCEQNLVNEGLSEQQLYMVGDPMYDSLLHHLPFAEKSQVLTRLDLDPDQYILLSIHRPRNVDNAESLNNIIEAVDELDELAIVFPVHPRTNRKLESFRLNRRIARMSHVKVIDPVSYHENLKLIKDAHIVLTDSGGMQKEAFWLGTPCITLRENTEWMETITLGANTLAGNDKVRIKMKTKTRLESNKPVQMNINPFGDGKAAEKIINIILTKRPFTHT